MDLIILPQRIFPLFECQILHIQIFKSSPANRWFFKGKKATDSPPAHCQTLVNETPGGPRPYVGGCLFKDIFL